MNVLPEQWAGVVHDIHGWKGKRKKTLNNPFQHLYIEKVLKTTLCITNTQHKTTQHNTTQHNNGK